MKTKPKLLLARLLGCVVVLASAAVGSGGCGRHSDPAASQDGAAKHDGGLVDGKMDSTVTPDAAEPDAAGCIEGALRCNGYVLEVCVSGAFETQAECDFGCASSPTPHCGSPLFSNGVLLEDVDSAGSSLELQPGVVTIDTDSGAITGPGSPPPGTYYFRLIERESLGLDPILLFAFDRVDIPEGCWVQVTGSRVLALSASESLTIHGQLDLSASANGTPGPGGYPGGVGGESGLGPGGGNVGQVGSLDFNEGGGGGGGYGRSGGPGGDGGSALGGEGGSPNGNPQLDPIIGGSGGGAGAAATGSLPGAGGSGGGAVMLIALEYLRIGSTGVVHAGGGGGQGGATQEAGGGGGAGGAVLLISPTVQILGIVAANGGGGGGSDASPARDGEQGLPSDEHAQGGGSGGIGGAAAIPSGGQGGDEPNHGTGGGGSTGRIRIESRDQPNLTGVISPAPSTTAFSLGSLQVE
jgi:hypothetical protein